jgi:oligopeptide transport system permease protein
MREAAPMAEMELGGRASVRYRSLWVDAARRFSRNRIAMLGLGFVLVLGLLALLAPLIDRYDPSFQDYSATREGLSWDHWLGTDALGRDMYSRILHGARISLGVGILTQVVALSIGLAVGMAAGMGGRNTDNLLMRATDIAFAFPDLLLLILVISVLGPSFVVMFVSIGVVSWPTLARLVRGQALSIQEREFVLAATATGAGRLRIAATHIMPNTLGPVIVAAVFAIPFAIFAEAALAFIGLGIPLPAPSWGRLVAEGHAAIRSSPHLVLFPTLAIALTMVSFTFIGDGLRDALDPRATREVGN